MRNVTITMSAEDWNKLTCYLLMNTKARQEEYDACVRLSKELDDEGNIKFPNMVGNAEFAKEQNEDIERMIKVIDNACSTPHITQPRLEEIATLLKDGLIEDDEEQAYIYFKETIDMDFNEANFLGLEFDKWEEYNEESLLDKEVIL